MTDRMDEKVNFLLDLMSSQKEISQRVVLVESFIQKYGPVPDEYRKDIHAAIRGENTIHNMEMFKKCKKCGRTFEPGKADFCRFCGDGCRPGKKIILDIDDIVLVEHKTMTQISMNVPYEYVEEIQKRAARETVKQLTEKLVEDGYISVHVSPAVDISTHMIMTKISAQIRNIKPSAALE